jgi:hypothetical protein
MSSSAICEGPSSPVATPACEPTIRSEARLIDAMRMKSYARLKKAAKADANGVRPRTSKPTAAAIICCSATYISKKRSGCASANRPEKVELETSPSIATTSSRAALSAASASP